MAPRRPAVHANALAALAAAWIHVSCGGGSPAPPAPPPPSAPAPTEPGATAVTGRERLAWTYDAYPGAVLFRAYVDGTPVDLAEPSCESAADGHTCSAPLPSLTPGVHVIAVSAVAAGDIEGERSSPITVQMVTRTTAAGGAAAMPGAGAMPPAIAIDAVMTDVPWPVQLATLPDGRVLVGQGDGRVRVFDATAPHRVTEALDAVTFFDPPPLGGVSITAAPPADAARGHVFLSYIAHVGDGTRRLSVVRVRDVDGRLGEPAAIFDAPLAPPSAATRDDVASGPRIAAGPDGLLYVLLPEDLTLDGAAWAAETSAAIVRLAPDGRLAPLEPGSIGTRPRVMGWTPATGALQLFDGTGRRVADAALTATAVSSAPAAAPSPFEAVTGDKAPALRLTTAALAAWAGSLGDPASWHGARGTTRLLDAVDASAWLPALPGLVEDVAYADGIAYLATRQPGSATSTVVRLRTAPAAVAR